MRVLDLFSGGGGAAMGYHQAGHEVVGVDHLPMPMYPFEFHLADALEFDLDGFDFVHASPPCQRYTALQAVNKYEHRHPDLIGKTRKMLLASGLPFVIENVAGAPVRKDLRLCGEMFGLGVIRHRYFEVHGVELVQPEHVKHRGRVAGYRHSEKFDGPYVAPYGDGGGKGSVADWQKAMGIGWINDKKTLAQAIPPAYTKWIGEQL